VNTLHFIRRRTADERIRSSLEQSSLGKEIPTERNSSSLNGNLVQRGRKRHVEALAVKLLIAMKSLYRREAPALAHGKGKQGEIHPNAGIRRAPRSSGFLRQKTSPRKEKGLPPLSPSKSPRLLRESLANREVTTSRPTP